MFELFLEKLKEDKDHWNHIQDSFIDREIASKTILLEEGEISKQIHFVKSGCLRQCFNKDGKDITFQFFFENQAVASFDSFMNSQPSIFSIEALEPTVISSISKEDFDKLMDSIPKFKDAMFNLTVSRFRVYTHLFLSRIKDSPQERYKDLVQNRPDIIQRIPQHYIASYLGITPISLSRIRNRK